MTVGDAVCVDVGEVVAVGSGVRVGAGRTAAAPAHRHNDTGLGIGTTVGGGYGIHDQAGRVNEDHGTVNGHVVI